ncbi:MAG: Stp1/IreP family PP2C-type Ser/Thr phosphatase [Ruminococcaceae bacterium]|nr:Stp1/IreP family PP2C-type Ser/Thr phosphatase [Oscillospiraceae bacterium]
MNVTGDTHIGLVRDNNQDAMVCGPLCQQAEYAVVCDGMGGANGGNVASEIAVRVIGERIRSAYESGQPVRSVDHLLESATAAANIEIYDKAKSTPELQGMGTTVVSVIRYGRTAYLSHVGDSRAYLLRGDVLEQVTRDHSVVQEMIESGQITEEQAKSHPRRHFVTRALGVAEEEFGEYDELDLLPGDKLLLCTDGLTNMVSLEQVAQMLTEEDNKMAVSNLIKAALDAGGADNVTVVIMDIC